jgi:hypothetical protein
MHFFSGFTLLDTPENFHRQDDSADSTDQHDQKYGLDKYGLTQKGKEIEPLCGSTGGADELGLLCLCPPQPHSRLARRHPSSP